MHALIVLGGDAPSAQLLRSCAAQADWVIAADSGLAAFDAAGISPDLLIGDLDSVDAKVLEKFAGCVPVRKLNCIKDDTDGVDALDVAIARGAKRITILGALGGRLDHALANVMLLVRASRRGVAAEICDDGVHMIRVDGTYVLEGAKGHTVSLLPLGTARGVTLSGFFYPLHDHELTSEHPLGMSNVVTEDTAVVKVAEGDLILFHHLKAV